jgi:N-ethylmaleimide reductase
MTDLFTPLALGPLTLPNRVLMAPLTRMRAGPGNVPTDLARTYYAQRASAGLIIAEATQISQQGQRYPHTPGIHSPEQVAGWRAVTDAVHAAGGLIFDQIWHVGRISHPSFQPGGGAPVAPSAVTPEGGIFDADFKQAAYVTPRALDIGEIPGIVADYAAAARNAKEAGFDGVEIHAANGYLIEQFLDDRTNHRTDAYGGSVQNRARFLFEVVDAVTDVWGADRVGVRLSPFGTANDSGDSDPIKLHSYVIPALSERGLAYLHLIEPRASGAGRADVDFADRPSAAKLFRDVYDGVLITAGNFDGPGGNAAIAEGWADAIAYGRHFISNPDLPRRIRLGAPLTPYHRPTFYGGDAKGYTDYAPFDGALETAD